MNRLFVAAVFLVGCAPDIPLWKAVADGDIKSVKQHLAAGADVNANSSGGWTQLTWAAHENRIEIGKLLIKKGADVNRRGDYGGNTALIEAIWGGHIEFVELLIVNGADVNAKSQDESDGITPLNVATQNGYKEIVELLITNGAEVNAISTMKTMKGVLQIGTTLDEAIKRNRPEIADLLRKHGGKTKKELEAEGK